MDSNAFTVKRTSRASKKTVLTIAPADPTEYPVDEADDDSMGFVQNADSNGSNPENSLGQPTKPSRSIPSDMAMAFSCKAMALALQGRSFVTGIETGMETNDPFEQTLDGILDTLEKTVGITFEGSTAIPRLQSLLDGLTCGLLAVREHANADSDEQAKSTLVHAIHAVVAAQCQRCRFEDAVEKVSQRAIYQFAYGLTHEINNPLANIAARAQQLISQAASDSDRRSLATIVDQSMRAHEMLSEMMRVVQPSTLHTRSEEVGGLVRQAIEIQEKQWMHSQVQCNLRGAAKPLYCAIDKAAMLEAICSLLQNAFQVCRPNDRVEVICEELDSTHPDYGPTNPTIDSAQSSTSRIRIAIRDTGPGMSYETLERAWDLYFSGRDHGRGLGISLAKVRRTIDAHQGLVWIQSKPNAGCSVEIRLPKLPAPQNPRKSFSI